MLGLWGPCTTACYGGMRWNDTVAYRHNGSVPVRYQGPWRPNMTVHVGTEWNTSMYHALYFASGNHRWDVLISMCPGRADACQISAGRVWCTVVHLQIVVYPASGGWLYGYQACRRGTYGPPTRPPTVGTAMVHPWIWPHRPAGHGQILGKPCRN